MTAPALRAPRSVYCVIDRLYCDREIAEAVCAGRFTHVGIRLELGPEPDWLGATLPPDKEWRIEWTKFYYGLDLAAAYADTGEDRFLRAWERLVRSWIRQVPVGHDRSDVAGRRIQNWIYAWRRFVAAPAFGGLADGLEDELLANLAAQVRHVREHLTAERNHRTLELYAIFIASLALPDLDADGELRRFALAELNRNLRADIRPDGVHREASTHYHCMVLRTYLGVRENARRFGLAVPRGYDDHLELACEFLLHCQRPDGKIPALSDSDTGSFDDLLALAGDLLDRADFRYAASAGRTGTAPARRYAGFPDGGYYTQRSGWGECGAGFRDQRFLLLDCGPLGDGGHGHYDLLSVEIAAGGMPLVMDPGRYTYSDLPPDWRRWFKETAAHNTVCVDGLDQTPYRRSKPKGATAEGRLLGRWSAPDFDLLAAEARSPAYDAVHIRWIAFVGGEYWIIVDRLRAATPHRYDLRFHLAPGAWERTSVVEGMDAAIVRAPGVALVAAGSRRPAIEAGWISPYYGIKHPAPVVSLVADGSAEVDFFTLVLPLADGGGAPTFRVLADGSGREPTVLEVTGAGPDGSARDLIAWGSGSAPLRLGGVSCRAAAAWTRHSCDGRPGALRACAVTEVCRDADHASSSWAGRSPAPWIAWEGGHEIEIGTEAAP